ncbi:MAG: transglycosylase SLT domain-containing protein [Blastocatellia bacterium]|nr:transglycosylase SLT domain-containing protein [Blastocatellia bacterium]
MNKVFSSFLSSALLAICLCFFALPTLAQTALPLTGQELANKIQLTIERSDESFQKGEEFFRAGEYSQARRSYDRAIEIILEAGIDIRSEARLKQQYQKLLEQINYRQSTLTKQLPTPLPLSAEAKDELTDAQAAQLAKQSLPAQAGASPLDEIAKINLTDDERKATEEEAKAALMAAKIDFGFRPNALVQSWINYYQGRGRTTMERGLQRAGKYMNMARRIFKEEGVPQDLAWLGQVESAWSPNARSWAAAVGLWQFIPGTAARFGLRQDYYIDERSSFEKATRASARYLKFLANRYAGNWELAMAAYNSGEGNVDRAIARSGYADFWEIYQRGLLPNETRNYVPNILATIIIAKNPLHYGFNVKPAAPLSYDTVLVNNSVDLRLAAEASDTSYEYLLELNPELKRGATPQGFTYGLRVPPGRGKHLQAWLVRIPADKRNAWRLMTAQNEDSFATIAKRTGVSESNLSAVNGGVEPKAGQKIIIPVGSSVRTVAAVAPKGAMSSGALASTASGTKMIVYTAKAGETINDIAARYGSSAKDIAALNRISLSTPLRAGQPLKVLTRSK